MLTVSTVMMIPKITAFLARSAYRSSSSLRSRYIPAIGALLLTTSAASCSSGDPSRTACAAAFSEEMLVEDFYSGITVRLDMAKDASELSDFSAKLSSSVDHWRKENRRGIWIHVPLEYAHVVPIAKDLGFKFHLVADGKLILSQWLPKDSESRLPLGPNHQVGVGCFVVNPKDPTQMLVVQEQTGPAAAYKLWKMPTGLADPREDLHEAAVRELREETNLEATFEGVVVFRQAHPSGTSGRTVSDLFFVCKMKVDEDKMDFEADGTEIAAIRWMPIEEYCKQERWQTSPVYMELNQALLKHSGQTLFNGHTLELGFGSQLGTGMNTIYKSDATPRD